MKLRPDDSRGHLVGGETAAVLGARVAGCAGGELPARVLPRLPLVVPMKPKLRKLGGDLAGLPLGERDPNPLADNLRQLEGPTQTTLQQIQNLLGRQLAVRSALLEVNVKQTRLLCCCRCRYRCRCRCRLMIAGLDSEPWR